MAIAALTVLLLVGIFAFLFISALGAFRVIGLREFFLGTNWNPTSYHAPSWGIVSLFVGTAMVSAVSLAIAVPFGIALAIFLSELAPLQLREVLKPLIEMIASIPTVILGLLGIVFLGPVIARFFGLSNGLSAFTAALLVALAALPTIASISEDALTGVPRRLREASLALGATHWQTVRRVVLPAAARGIAAAVMLGLGRVVGETMIVLMVAGNSRAFPTSLFDPVRPMTANIAIEIKEVVVGSLHWQALFAIALVLFLFTFAVNFFADVMIRRKTIVL